MKKSDFSNINPSPFRTNFIMFIETLDEVLFYYSFESYKLPALNAHYLCRDILTAKSNIDNDLITEGNFIPLAEEFERLTVITYSLHVFEILKKKEGFTLYLCAGAYLRDENAFCGQWALQMLEQFHAKTAFLFPSAISLQNGIMDYDQELYHLQRAMMKHADRSVFLADSDKFEKSALLKLADVNEAVTFVTDSGLRKEILELYQENGIEMIRGEQKQ